MLLLFKNKPHTGGEKLLYGLVTLVLFCVILIRGYFVPPTQDEVTSFFEYSLGGIGDAFILENSNNHLLNSLLGSFSLLVFGDSMVAFRLPNMLFFLLYALVGYRFGERLRLGQRWALHTSLLLAHPIIEYFSLARGYGLSFALLCAHLLFLVECNDSKKGSAFVLACLFLSLAVLANITLIIPAFVSLIILLVLSRGINLSPMTMKVSVTGALSVLVFQGSLGYSYRSIITEHFNNTVGFYRESVGSVVNMLGYSALTIWGMVIILIPFGVGILLTIIDSRAIRFRRFSSATILSAMLIGVVVGFALLGLLFDLPLPKERIGLFLIPMYFLALNSGLSLAKSTTVQVIALLASWLPAAFMAFSLFSSFELGRSGVEPYAHVPESLFQSVLDYHQSSGSDFPPIVSGDERMSHAWRYYNYKNGGTLNASLGRTESSRSELFITSENPPGSELVATNESGVSIYRIQPKLLSEIITLPKHPATNKAFIDLVEQSYSGLGPSSVGLKGRFLIGGTGKVAIVTELKNAEGGLRYYLAERIDLLLKEPQVDLSRTLSLPPCENCGLKVYLFNIQREEISVLSY